jgi:hypothetical protein
MNDLMMSIMKKRSGMKIILVLVSLFWVLSAEAAVDSYRFLHVTISTPWYLFIFLLGGVLSPFILMAVIAWYSAARKSNRKSDESEPKSSEE